MQRAAKYADVWIPYLYTPEALAQSIDLIRQYRVNEAMAPVRSSIHVFVTVYPDAVQAQRVAAELLSTMYRRDFTGTASRYFVAGTPAQCRTRLKEYVAAGASSIQAALLCSEDDMDSMLILMAEQVLPEFRSPRGSQ